MGVVGSEYCRRLCLQSGTLERRAAESIPDVEGVKEPVSGEELFTDVCKLGSGTIAGSNEGGFRADWKGGRGPSPWREGEFAVAGRFFCSFLGGESDGAGPKENVACAPKLMRREFDFWWLLSLLEAVERDQRFRLPKPSLVPLKLLDRLCPVLGRR
jgi:hypothetical protein